ncbi:MAG TPA: DUF6662 family protein [Candidatus Paceibacterota bacterium]|nr:DUF6662 family protein [Candidatus Paceibacterota bacterium]
MNLQNKLLLGLLAGIACINANANERFFTYTYEPETLPQGATEFEQWITLRSGRNKTVGQENYSRWDLREELEYGVTDNYTVSLYLNQSSATYRDPATGDNVSSGFEFKGVSLENRYMLLNPAEHAVGLALYLEPTFNGDEAELEQKIILGQRLGDWKWALNLTHATEWEDNFHSTEGEVEVSFGITRHLNNRWSVGLEARDHNELPEYVQWENTAFYAGPVVTFTEEKWWATLTVMPQVLGANFTGNVDGDHQFELEGHERLNVRLIIGFGF